MENAYTTMAPVQPKLCQASFYLPVHTFHSMHTLPPLLALVLRVKLLYVLDILFAPQEHWASAMDILGLDIEDTLGSRDSETSSLGFVSPYRFPSMDYPPAQ
jgi:hypothetical protein